MPLLGVDAPSAFSPDASTPRDDEAFQMLSAALTYFNVDRPLASVAIISPGPAEGKTTVAVGLARRDRPRRQAAILIDADLRRPQVAPAWHLRRRTVWAPCWPGSAELSEVLIEPQMDAAGRRDSLLVLPAGPPPPNPAALLRSGRCARCCASSRGRPIW